ncbi:hypothetical protein [Ursidibacter sp. B-7004-1]
MKNHSSTNHATETIQTATNDSDLSNIVTFNSPTPETMIEWEEDEIQELSDFFLRSKIKD